MKQNQNARILAHLKIHSITPIHALKLYGCFRLGARIWDLRQQGHVIWRDMIRVRTRGGIARVACYHLSKQWFEHG